MRHFFRLIQLLTEIKTTLPSIARVLVLLFTLSSNVVSSAYAAERTEKLSIEMPDKIGSLVVDKSNYADVVTLLGDPELTEHTKADLLELRYPTKGIEFTIYKNKQMRVARIEVYRPFTGSSAEGIRLGMSISDAKQIVSSQFGAPRIEFDGYVDWDIPNTLALKYEDGIVIAIKMLGK